MPRSFLKQVLPLLVSLLVIMGLIAALRYFEARIPEPFDRLLVEALPEVPDLSGYPEELAEALHDAHSRLEDKAVRRQALVDLAQLYHANGFKPQAESCYLGLESLEPEEARWPYLLAVVKGDQRDKAELAHLLARSLSLDPSNSFVYLRLGQVYTEGIQLEKARLSFEYRLLGKPNDPWAYLGLGEVALYAKDYAQAAQWLEQAVEALPSSGLALELLYEARIELDQIPAAREIRLKLERLEGVAEPRWDDPFLAFLPDYCYQAETLANYAREAREEGDLDRGLELLERAVRYGGMAPEALGELKLWLEEFEASLE